MSRTRCVLAAVVAAAAAAVATAAPADWFGPTQPMSIRLDAPFTNLFAHAQQEGYAVHGAIAFRDRGRDVRVDDVTITVRGHTSRRESECSFPKLKVAWAKESIKIGTHCGDAPDNTITERFGRLANERSPIREAFVYRLLHALEVPSLLARPARATYVYTDGDRRSIVRNAFVLEDNANARRRLDAVKEIQSERFTDARDAFLPADAVRLAFTEALIGNFDWCLRFYRGDKYRCDARHPLWNVLAFAWPDGRVRPLPYDFDVTGMVAGRHRWFGDIFDEKFLPSRSRPAIEVIAQLQHARALFDRAVLDAARRRFAAHKAAAYQALADSRVDDEGRTTITAYMDAFFESMESDAAFYRPVVTAPDAHAFLDAAATMPVCPSRGAVAVGTPVSDPLQTRGSMIQVVLLDAMWEYAPPVHCAAVHRKPVWIDRSAVGTAFP